MLTALAGGVGAARFLRGLVDVVDPADVSVVVNTGDDDEFHGLWVCPDLDSVTYRLADAQNPETGWGLAGETFATIEALARYGEPDVVPARRPRPRHPPLPDPPSPGRVDAQRGDGGDHRRMGALDPRLLPMTDDRVATRITVRDADGREHELALQEWFVRHRAEPNVVSVRFEGVETARPAPGVLDALERAETILVCPSNPVISIGPILAVPGIRDVLVRRRDRVVGVSPIVGGHPVRGPADRLMGPLGIDVSCVGVARAYREFCSTLVIDATDGRHAAAVEALGVRAIVADTVMRDARVAAALAREALAAVA